MSVVKYDVYGLLLEISRVSGQIIVDLVPTRWICAPEW